MTDATSQQQASDSATEAALYQFIIQSYVSQMSTATLVRVVSCTNTGGLAKWGTVDVQPVVSQIAGANQSVQYQQLFRLPYTRIQGGKNAVIIDPEVGDLGIAIFASRDISALKKQESIDQVASGEIRGVTPSSARQFSMADGLYLGGVLNGVPEQFVRFSSEGVEVVSPTKIRLVAPEIEIEATESVTIDSPENDIKGGGTKIDDKVFLTHAHSGVQSGPSNTGPVA